MGKVASQKQTNKQTNKNSHQLLRVRGHLLKCCGESYGNLDVGTVARASAGTWATTGTRGSSLSHAVCTAFCTLARSAHRASALSVLSCTRPQLAKAHPELLDANCLPQHPQFHSSEAFQSLFPNSKFQKLIWPRSTFQPRPHKSRSLDSMRMAHPCVRCSLPPKQPLHTFFLSGLLLLHEAPENN